MKNLTRVELKKNPLHKMYLAIMIISIICLALSIIIQIEKTSYSKNQGGLCSAITGANGCEAVQTSNYGKILGMDNPIYGMIGFALIIIFTSILILRKNKDNNIVNKVLKYVTITGGIISGITAILFLYVQTFILHTYCFFCVIVDILSLTLLGISIYLIFKEHK